MKEKLIVDNKSNFLSFQEYLKLRQQEEERKEILRTQEEMRKEHRKSCERAEGRMDSKVDNDKALTFAKCMLFIGLAFAILVVSLSFAIFLVG